MENFYEMTETEAIIQNMVENLDFMSFQLSTGNIFTNEQRDQTSTDKINNLTDKAGDHLIAAMEKLTELKAIVNNSVEVLPDDKAFMELSYEEMLEEISKNPERFLHEVDSAESIAILENSKILHVTDVLLDKKDAVLIEIEAADGQHVDMIKTDDTLFCSGWKEVVDNG